MFGLLTDGEEQVDRFAVSLVRFVRGSRIAKSQDVFDKEAEDGAQLLQFIGCYGAFAVVYGVDGFARIEQMGNHDRGVHIVAHGLFALLAQPFRVDGRDVRGAQFLQAAAGLEQAFQSFLGSLKRFIAEIDRAAVMCLKDEETYRDRCVCLGK